MVNVAVFKRQVAALCLLALCDLPPGNLQAADWSAFRGNRGDGFALAADPPIEWNSSKNVLWKVEVPGTGNGSPIVVGQRLFLACARDLGRQRSLVCFDTRDGRELWKQTVAVDKIELTLKSNPYCGSTPAAAGDLVVVWHGTGGLHAYTQAGELRWSRDFGEIRHLWGYGTSPIILRDRVILHSGATPNIFIAAVRLDDGALLWKTEEPGGQSNETPDGELTGSWCTPVVVTLPPFARGGKGGSADQALVPSNETQSKPQSSSPPSDGPQQQRNLQDSVPVTTGQPTPPAPPCKGGEFTGVEQIVCAMPTRVVSYDPGDGHIIWTCKGLSSERGNLVYASPIVGAGYVIAMAGYQGPALAVRFDGTGDVTETHRVWHTTSRNPQRRGSGVFLDGAIYIANADGGTIQCLDAATGNENWSQRVAGGPHWASLVCANGLLYATNQSGTTRVFRPNPRKFELLAENMLGELVNATPAFAGDEIFIRTEQNLYCISKTDASTRNRLVGSQP